jgi:hypothetical protein
MVAGLHASASPLDFVWLECFFDCRASAKWTFGLLWEGKIGFHDFSLPNRKSLTKNKLGRFFKEIVKPISLKNEGRVSILQKASWRNDKEHEGTRTAGERPF